MAHPEYIRRKAIQLRVEKKLTIDEIAERLSLNKTTIYYWVKDIPIPRKPGRALRTKAQELGARAMQAKYKGVRGELLAKLGDAISNLAAIELQRRLTSAAALLPLRSARRLTQPRSHVHEPRDLDLHARFTALRVAMEDVDDDARAIEHLRARRLLEVAGLAR
mgnify:CR=1 FL=1